MLRSSHLKTERERERKRERKRERERERNMREEQVDPELRGGAGSKYYRSLLGEGSEEKRIESQYAATTAALSEGREREDTKVDLAFTANRTNWGADVPPSGSSKVAKVAQASSAKPLVSQIVERDVLRAAEPLMPVTEAKGDVESRLKTFYVGLYYTLSKTFNSDGSMKQRSARKGSDDGLESAGAPGGENPSEPLLSDRAGLGMNSDDAAAADIYMAYREKRSGAYHQKIVGTSKRRKKFRRY